ncbi:hypothetical protein S83_072080 [Arachis hypogaea]
MEKEISEVQRSRATQRWRKHDGEEQGYSRTCHRTEIGQVLESAARHALESRKRSLHTSSSSSKCILFLLLVIYSKVGLTLLGFRFQYFVFFSFADFFKYSFFFLQFRISDIFKRVAT